jgi:hypothetical protein
MGQRKLDAAHRAGQLQFFGKHAALTNVQAFAAYLAPLRNREWVVYREPAPPDARRKYVIQALACR